jgi:hypothetical protein
MPFNTSPTELTTAATDALMGLLSLVLLLRLQHALVGDLWQRGVWSAVFALLVGASALGAFVHGVELGADTRRLLWLPLYLCLGLAVSLFAVGAVADWLGTAAARQFLPWAIAAGVAFVGASQLLGGAFVVFVIYEGVAMLGALAIYVLLAVRGAPGALTTAAGIALTLAASVVQASPLKLTIVVPFDHNGLFHLVQMPAIVLVARGVELLATGGRVVPR